MSGVGRRPGGSRRLWSLGVVVLLVGLTACQTPDPDPAVVVERIDAGGPGGQPGTTPLWEADTNVTPHPAWVAGSDGLWSTTSAVDKSDPSVPPSTPMALFQTARWDASGRQPMTYRVPVADGTYVVRLYFAETWTGAHVAGGRVFDVSVEGSVVLDDFDVFAAAGPNKGITRSFVAAVDDGSLEVRFGHVVQNPFVNAIEVLRVDTTTPTEEPTLGATPTSVAFPSTTVGQISQSQVTLRHTGAASSGPLTITGASLQGASAGSFDLPASVAGAVLDPGETVLLPVVFAPTSTGTKTASVSIGHDGAGSPLTVGLSGTGTSTTPPGPGTPSFSKSTVPVTLPNKPTSIQWGPDGRLYVAQNTGVISALTVVRNGPGDYDVTANETIANVRNAPNRDDLGNVVAVNNRLVTGMVVTGTASNPVIHVASSDPRIGAGSSLGDLNLDTNSGILHRLTKSGGGWTMVDLVRGLPRSEENHMTNGLVIDPATNTLYMAQGGNTNHGAPSNNFAHLPEYALSAAVLSVDLDAIGNSTYDLPTLDDQDRPGTNDANDPFGGNDGRNQARLVPGGPVQVHAPGFRNPYDLVLASSGFYTIDNGGNAGWGGIPIGEGPGGTCTNGVNDGGPNLGDTLHRITGPGYYAGHPNPTRANAANTFNPANPQSPVPAGNPIECDFRDNFEKGALTTFPTSTNGLDEYTTDNFGGAMAGDLITASYNNSVYWIRLNSVGAVDGVSTLFSNVGGFPLDIVASEATDPFPGTIWVGDFATKDLIVFEPGDYDGTTTPTCTGVDSWSLDEDGDGFANADEIDNGTDPCSSADLPPDADGDGLSDRNDPDDDNDGRPDLVDPFALDPTDGSSTVPPFELTWDNDAPPAGGILGLGFTGSMVNGSTDYLDTYDITGMTVGGAAGVVTVDELTSGTARGAANDQDHGLQLGVNAGPTTAPFTVHSRLPAPFSSQAPEPGHRMGIQIGTGHQDHYLELVASGQGGGRVEAVLEVNGVPSVVGSVPLAMPGPSDLDLYLTVDPATGVVEAAFAAATGGVAGPRTTVGTTVVPASWMKAAGLAVGIIGTSGNASVPLTGSWSFLLVEPADGTDPPPPPPSGSSWTTAASMPNAREAIAVSEVGGRLYVGGGGCQGPTCLGTHRRYDPATDAWQALPPIPQNLTHLQSAVVGDDIYYLGGLTEPFPGDEVPEVYVFDTATSTFSTAPPMPAARNRGAAGVVSHNGDVYVVGGLRGGHDGVAAPYLDRYDPDTGTWTALPDLPRPRDHFQAVVANGRIIAVGGRNTASGFLADVIPQVDVYDLATNTWSTLPTVLPTPRGGAGTVVVDGEVVVVGGETPTAVIAAVEVLNPLTGTWRTLAPMPTPRHGMQAAVLCGRVHVVGGSTAPTFQPSNLHQVLDPDGGGGCT